MSWGLLLLAAGLLNAGLFAWRLHSPIPVGTAPAYRTGFFTGLTCAAALLTTTSGLVQIAIA